MMLKLFLYFLLLFFSMLILNPEQRLKFFRNFSAFSTDFKYCSIRVKSSANRLNLIMLLSILIPFIYFSHILFC